MSRRRRAARKGCEFEFDLAVAEPIVLGSYTGKILVKYGALALCVSGEPGRGDRVESQFMQYRICMI